MEAIKTAEKFVICYLNEKNGVPTELAAIGKAYKNYSGISMGTPTVRRICGEMQGVRVMVEGKLTKAYIPTAATLQAEADCRTRQSDKMRHMQTVLQAGSGDARSIQAGRRGAARKFNYVIGGKMTNHTSDCRAPGCPMLGTVSSSAGSGEWWCFVHHAAKPSRSAAISAELQRLGWLVDITKRMRAQSATTRYEDIENDFNKEFLHEGYPQYIKGAGESLPAWLRRIEDQLKLSCDSANG